MNTRKRTIVLLSGLIAVSVLAMIQPLMAQETPAGKDMLVKAKDGREITGVVTKTATGVSVVTKFGTVTLTKEEIASIEDVVTPKDAYIQKKMKIDLKDATALYELAKWGWDTHNDDKDILKMARGDLDDALKIDKEYRRADLLRKQIDAKIKLLNSTVSVEPGTGGGEDVIKVNEKYLVSQRGIQWIRLKELRETDRGITIAFENKVLDRYMDSMRGRPEDGWDKQGKKDRFLAMPRMKQVMEILKNKEDDTELLKDIIIKNDPDFMKHFRTSVWPMVRTNCATATCHGGPQPKGGLKFFVLPGRNDRVDYTNYAILVGFKTKGVPTRHMVDRQNVDEGSLLLQYALNRKVAKYHHPKEISPVYTSKNSAGYRLLLKWADDLQGPRAPNYHLTWKAPFGMRVDTTGIPDMGPTTPAPSTEPETPAAPAAPAAK